MARGPELARDLVGEIRPWATRHPVVSDHIREGSKGVAGLLRADHAVLLHATKDVAEALLCTIGMPDRIEVVWAFGDPGQQRALAQGEFACRFPKVAAGGHFEARRCPTEKDRIQIEFQNL